MKIYIAIGGMGCYILHKFQKYELSPKDYCYYIDTSGSDLQRGFNLGSPNIFNLGPMLDNVSDGAGALRSIGKATAKYAILSNRMENFFSSIKEVPDVELVFIITSFGGTASGAVFEISDYLQALLWFPGMNNCKDCKVIAFNYNCFHIIDDASDYMKNLFEMNTIQLVMEASVKSKERTDILSHRGNNSSVFNPFVNLYLIDEPVFDMDELYKVLLMDEDELSSLDRKSKYTVKQKSSSPEVFISYSSEDQKVADMVVDTLKDNGIESWIASRNIVEGAYAKQIIQAINGSKIFVVLLSNNSISSQHVKNEIDRAFSRLNDGLVIIPFIIEECELDDECQYYLCRQETFNGTVPPIEERINNIVDRIKNVLE